jgi:hypothetical protein
VLATGIPNTWVAGAQPWHPVRDDNRAQPVTLFDVTFNPATRRVEITKLPVPAIPGTDLVTVALSPDGTRLAEVTLTLGPVVRSSTGSPNQTGVAVLRVYTMTGGTGKPRVSSGVSSGVSSRTLATSPNADLLADYSLTWLGGAVAGTAPLSPARQHRRADRGLVSRSATAPGHWMSMTTLPRARRSATYLRAAAASASGNRAPMCGRRRPAANRARSSSLSLRSSSG